MSLPENVLASTGVTGTYLYPDNLAHTKLLDYELAGQAIGNGAGGMQIQVWTCFYESGTIRVRVLGDEGAGTAVLSVANVTELSFSFDRSMRPAIAYIVDNAQAYLYWYDTTILAYRTTSLGFVRCVRVTHDDKRLRSDQTSDVLVAYLNQDALCYRQQRDRYTVERVLATGIPEDADLLQAGMTDRLRVEFKVEVVE